MNLLLCIVYQWISVYAKIKLCTIIKKKVSGELGNFI
jgi:hypothetical protein